MKKTTLATLASLGGYGIFGGSFLFSSVALSQASPMVLLSVRFTIAFITLNLIVLIWKIPMTFRGKPIKNLLLLGIVHPVIYYICENYGIAMTSTSFSGVILGTIPVFGLLLGRTLLKEKVTALQFVCAAVSIFGVGLTCVGGEFSFSPLGAVLLLSASAIAALSNVLSRDTARHFSAMERTYIMFAFGSVAFTLIALFQNRSDLSAFTVPLSSSSFWGATIYLAVLSSVGAFLLLNFATSHISSSRVSLFTNCATVISVLLGIFVMGDVFAPVQLVGVGLIVGSMFIVSVYGNLKSEA